MGRLVSAAHRVVALERRPVHDQVVLEWDQLRYMLAIHRGGSMQAAAVELRVDRATVVRHPDGLEAGLGVRLFERRRDGCTLTEAGLEIISTVQGIEQATVALAARVKGTDKRPEGLVTLTVPEFFAAKVLAPALARFHDLYPGITLEVATGHSFLNLARGDADIALRNRRPDHQTLVARRVGSVAIALFASKAYIARQGRPGGELNGHSVILFDETLRTMPGAEWLETRLAGAKVLMRSNEILPLLAAVKTGAGIGSLPAIVAADEPDLVPLPPGIIGLPEIFLVTHRDLRGRARVRAVYDFIIGICTERAADLSGRAMAESLGDRGDPSISLEPEPSSEDPLQARAVSSPAGS